MGDGAGDGSGDKIAKLYLAQRPSLRRFIARFLRRPDDVEDVLQETFARAYASGKAAEAKTPKAYLYAIARNLALDERARRGRRIADYVEDFDAETVLSDEPSVDDQVHGRLEYDAFCRAVATLSPQCRKAFLLRKVHGLSHKEIAQRLGISLSTVEKHLAKGLQHCASALRQEGFDRVTKSSGAQPPPRRTTTQR